MMYSKKISYGKRNYFAGKKHCRSSEVYLYNKDMFCLCCDMQIRLTPPNKQGKERLGQGSIEFVL
ncbi:MAG: hypothetical protein ACJ71O_07470 [Nitrososphaeraceae archaeon]